VQDLTALHTLVFNSLDDQIALIDQAGTIVEVNSAWTNFGVENGISSDYVPVGNNYLKVLSGSANRGDGLAREAANGILDVVNGQRASFYFEYPCHSPDEKRWFMMQVIRMRDDSRRLFIISHRNITERKLAEERAEHLAMHDPITGLANRRCFNLFLHKEFRSSIRDGSAISLIEFDVDYFKDYNDECGHLAGDQCLAEVGQALATFARRPNDLAARLGGDEFALLMGDTDFVESQRFAEAILQSINDLRIFFGESKQVTVSVGVASVIPDRHQHEEFLFKEADKALYRAKLAGRNRVVHANSFPDTQA
jgi:diguanylate cyclase (GGDEF)-like protein